MLDLCHSRSAGRRRARVARGGAWDLKALIRGLISDGYLVDGSPAEQVARQILDGGEDSLSREQRMVFERSLLHAVRAYANAEPRLRILERLMRDG